TFFKLFDILPSTAAVVAAKASVVSLVQEFERLDTDFLFPLAFFHLKAESMEKMRYYALAAAAGLISYVQDSLFIYYSAGSIKIDYQEPEGYAIIDSGRDSDSPSGLVFLNKKMTPWSPYHHDKDGTLKYVGDMLTLRKISLS
ncbi:hypothetical protein NQ317_011634, partial [Molorchus minor]